MSVANAAPAVAAITAAVEVANPIDVILNSLNTNPYFIGTMMLLLNLGGRFLQLEISKGQEKFFQQVWVRRILVFTVIFVATRNVLVALFMSIIVLALLSFLFNENSSLYLGGVEDKENFTIPASGLTAEESEILRRLSEKQARTAAPAAAGEGKQEKPAPVEIYGQNLAALQSFS
jgi:hypothetical protein